MRNPLEKLDPRGDYWRSHSENTSNKVIIIKSLQNATHFNLPGAAYWLDEQEVNRMVDHFHRNKDFMDAHVLRCQRNE